MRATYLPRHASTPAFRAGTIPRSGASITRKRASRCANSRAMAQVASRDPLSTTTHSKSASVWRATLFRASPRVAAASNAGSSTETSGSATHWSIMIRPDPRRSSMTDVDLDQLSINTIRTLSMDAVQAAHSGHPGTPMAMAPVAYCLWQRFLRFDPEHPIWPNRDRFVLSAGHASMLLYSLLFSDGSQNRQPQVRNARAAVGHARRHPAFSPARQQVPRPPRVPLDERRRNHDRTARTRCCDQRRHGDRVALDGRALQPAELRDVRLRRLRAGRRRLHDGRPERRSRVARRSPRALEPVLDLRQQPDHDRGPHRARVQRRRRHALHRPRLERHARRRRQRSCRCSNARFARSKRPRTARR